MDISVAAIRGAWLLPSEGHVTWHADSWFILGCHLLINLPPPPEKETVFHSCVLNKENIIYRIKLWFKRLGYEKAQDKILGKVGSSGTDKSKDQWFLNLGVLGPPGEHVEVDGLLLQVHTCMAAFIRALPFHFKGPQILWSPLMEPPCFHGSFYNTTKLYHTGMWSSFLMDMSNEWLLIIGHLWVFYYLDACKSEMLQRFPITASFPDYLWPGPCPFHWHLSLFILFLLTWKL